MVINIKREGKLSRAGIQLTSQLGNTLNGGESIDGKSPEELKKEMGVLSDISQQAAAADISGTDSAEGSNPLLAANKAQGQAAVTQTATTQAVQQIDQNAAQQGELGKALSGQQSNLDLSKVPQDQKDFLLKNMMLLGGAQ